jgi:glutaredoxin
VIGLKRARSPFFFRLPAFAKWVCYNNSIAVGEFRKLMLPLHNDPDNSRAMKDVAAIRTVTLYTRPGCHLCEDAADLLERLATRLNLAIVEVNILEDANLYERYKHSIPVASIGNGAILTAPIREEELLRWLT